MQFKFLKLLLVTTTLFCSVFSQSALARQEFTWNQDAGDTDPTPMYGQDQGVCFLTAVQGKFEGDGESLNVYLQNRQWFLGGQSGTFGVGGKATCLAWNEIVGSYPSIYGPYTWHQRQGSSRTFLGNFDEGNGVCFLSGVSGKFAGSGEHVEITFESYSRRNWMLGGDSGKRDVSATAYCIPTSYNYTKLTDPYNWNQYKSPVYLGSGYAGCFLTGFVGNFQGSKERVALRDNYDQWYLEGNSGGGKNNIGASARCYRK